MADRPAADQPSDGPRDRPGADRAVIVFAEEHRLAALRLLKPGFRHGRAYLRTPEGWIGVDSLLHRLEIRCFPAWHRAADLAAHLRRLGQCARRRGRESAAPPGAAAAVFRRRDGRAADRPA
ncbi:MAG TPA: hypothetical protein VF194_12300 [Ferrovibrio sp.]|uniref:hypothetical protein n=1 Tax=Ferrovibrio sp. TaxID=1917215 RepID=UPI002ED28443